MAVAIKCALVFFMVLGIALAVYGAWEIWKTVGQVSASSGKAKAQFAGYYREQHRVPSGISLKGSGVPSITHYPEFIYHAEDGSTQTVREDKAHVFEIYKPGQEVEILLFPYFKPRLAGFYALYVRDLLILLMGLGFLLIAVFFWKYALPLAAPSGSAELREVSSETAAVPSPVEEGFKKYLETKIGPVSVKFILIASGVFMGLGLIVALAAGLKPYFDQMGFGPGGRLMKALQEEHFDEARRMIEKGAGIHAVNQYGQNPLLVALEAGRMDLAAMLIQAGADVNIRSKMFMTPLRVAAEAGDLEMVKLLLQKGVLLQHPDDHAPPFLYAMVNGHDAVARLLIEAGTDLHRRYPFQNGRSGTVGDLAVLAGKQELIELIRQRGGTFTLPTEEIKP